MRKHGYTSLLLLIILRFTCGEWNICSTIEKSQSIINMIVWKILFHFLSLLTALVVKHRHILAGIYVISLKNCPRPNVNVFQQQMFTSVKRLGK